MKIYFLLLAFCSLGMLYSFTSVEMYKNFLQIEDPYGLCNMNVFLAKTKFDCINEIKKINILCQQHVKIFEISYNFGLKLILLPYYIFHYSMKFIQEFHKDILFNDI